jgi:hypothetical protein
MEIRFNLVCPRCGGIEYQMNTLDLVPSQRWHCLMCSVDVEAELDDRVEVGFSAELGIRELNFDVFGDAQSYRSACRRWT